MNGKGEGLIGCGILLIYVFPLAILVFALWKLWEWCEKNPETAGNIAIGTFLLITAPIWFPPIAISIILMLLCRDFVVHNWSVDASMEDEKRAVLIWIFVVPIAMLCGWILFWWWLPIPVTGFTLFLMTLMTLIAMVQYYYHYFAHPPQKNNVVHPMWPRFVRAEEEMKFDLRSRAITSIGRLKLWWHRIAD